MTAIRKKIRAERREPRKQGERARLRAIVRSEALLADFLCTTPDWIFVRDVQHRYLQVSQSYADSIGVNREEVVGKTDTELNVPEEHRTLLSTQDDQVIAEKRTLVFEADLVQADGKVLSLHTIKSPLFDTSGRIYAVLTIGRDITAVVEAQKSRLQNEAQIRAMVDAIPGQVAWINRDLEFIGVNQSFAAARELKAEDLVTRGLCDLKGEHRLSTLMSDIFESERNQVRVELPMRFTDRTADCLLSIQKYNDGQEAVLVGIDITELKAAEEKFRILFEHSSDAHLLFDEHNAFVCNPAVYKILGCSPEEFLIHWPAAFFPPIQPDGSDSFQLMAEMEAKARDLGTFRFEWTLLRLSGDEVPVEMTLTRVKVSSKIMLLFVWHDLTERKRTELKLLESSKMSSLGEMASGIAHEINNPLAIIAGRAEQLKELAEIGKADPTKVIEICEKIENTSMRISRIIKGLLNFARDSENDTFEVVDLRNVIDDTLELCRERFRNHSVPLERLGDDEQLALSCRPGQLSQVVLNLLNNAHDAVLELEVKWVRLEIDSSSDQIIIRVVDSGNGIPFNIREKLMQPFFTTKEVGKGTGLGLSISRGIVEAHGGTLQIDGNADNTTFVVTLPRHRESTKAA